MSRFRTTTQIGSKPLGTALQFAREKAARLLRAGWPRECAIGHLSEYGFLRQHDKSPARPLATLAQREIDRAKRATDDAIAQAERDYLRAMAAIVPPVSPAAAGELTHSAPAAVSSSRAAA